MRHSAAGKVAANESGCAVEMVIIDPFDLQAAQEQDLAMHISLTTRCESLNENQAGLAL